METHNRLQRKRTTPKPFDIQQFWPKASKIKPKAPVMKKMPIKKTTKVIDLTKPPKRRRRPKYMYGQKTDSVHLLSGYI